MDSNTHSTGPPAGRTDGLAELATAVEELATQDLDGLTDAVRAERVLALRRLLDRLEGHWLQELAAVDARGAAGADHDQPVGSTASWLRSRLRMGAGAAHTSVRTARALFRGPLTATARALTDGQLSPAHARVLAAGTHDLPSHTAVEAEPVLWKRPDGWTHPDCAAWSPTCVWSPTPTANATAPSDGMSSGACGCRRPWTT
jgi:Domain of unknown function (DUF222)